MKKRALAMLAAVAMAVAMAPAALAQAVTTAPTAEMQTPETAMEEVIPETTPETAEEKAPREKIPMTVKTGPEVAMETTSATTGLDLDYTEIVVKPGETVEISAATLPYRTEDAARLEWTSSDKGTFTIAAGEGESCKITGVEAAEELLTVKNIDNPNATATCKVIVSTEETAAAAYRPITDVTLDKEDVTTGPNRSFSLVASLVPSDTTSSRALYWRSDNTDVATVEAGANGYCAVYTHKSGTAHIYVRTSNNLYRSCTVTVGIPIESVSLNYPTMQLAFNTGARLIATIKPADTTADKTLKWTSSDEGVATVDANGYVLARAAGTAVITVRTTNNKTATSTVTVLPDAGKVVAFVTRLYNVCLDRDPDPAGLNLWINELTSGRQSGAQVAYGFVFSNEFKGKNYCNTDYVKHLYTSFLGRNYDAAGLAHWVGLLTSGTTREEIFNGFSQSGEFNGICQSAGIKLGSPIAVPKYGTVPTGACSACGEQDGVTQFVTRMYRVCLDREPEGAGLRDWCNKLWAHSVSGRTLGYGFFNSNEFKEKNYNNADYIEHLYAAFLGRKSDAPGKAVWLDHMSHGYSRDDVFNGFVASNEFREICARYGIVRD